MEPSQSSNLAAVLVPFAIGAVLFGYALARFRATIGTMV